MSMNVTASRGAGASSAATKSQGAGASAGTSKGGSEKEKQLENLKSQLGQLQSRQAEIQGELSQREAEKMRREATLVGDDHIGFNGKADSVARQNAFTDAGNGQNANSIMARRNADLVGDDSIGFSGEADSAKRQNMFTAADAVEGKIAKTGAGGEPDGSTTQDLQAELGDINEQVANLQEQIAKLEEEVQKEKEEKEANNPENKAEDLNNKMQAMRVQGQLDNVNNEISIKESQASSGGATKGQTKTSSDLVFANSNNSSSAGSAQNVDQLYVQKQSLESQLANIRGAA